MTFARQIAGDKANIELILPPGVESHIPLTLPHQILLPFIIPMSFLYTGSNMETWAK